MKLPNQAKPVTRMITPESRRLQGPGSVQPADFLSDLLKGVQTGTQIVGSVGQSLLPLLPLLL